MSDEPMRVIFRVTLATIVLTVLSCARVVYADIRVSPVALYLSDEARNGRVYLYNDGNQDKEVEVGVEFGYPVSDERGNVTFRFFQTVNSDEPSATGWIQVFPEKFTLPAGESQMVVVMASPPTELPDGEYWARPVLTFRQTHSVNEKAPENMEGSQLVLSMNYRHGSVFTGINVRGIKVEPAVNKVSVTLDLERRGNAAFLGTIECRLKAEDGSIVGCDTTEVAVYHSLNRRLEIDVASLQAGKYVVEVVLNTDRRGNNPGDILHSTAIQSRAAFVITRVSGPDVSLAIQPPYGLQKGNAGGAHTVNDSDGQPQSKAIEDALKRVREMEALLANLLKNVPEHKNN